MVHFTYELVIAVVVSIYVFRGDIFHKEKDGKRYGSYGIV